MRKDVTLNFYTDDDSKIQQCISEIKSACKYVIDSITIKDFPSEEEGQNPEFRGVKKQVVIVFATEADCDGFRQDKACWAIYQKYRV